MGGSSRGFKNDGEFMSTREKILNKLRASLAQPNLPFPSPNPSPLTAQTRMTVTHAEGDMQALARRFGTELENLFGSYEIVETVSEARLALITHLLKLIAEEESQRRGVQQPTGQERTILSWTPDKLPIAYLPEAFADVDLELISPDQVRTTEERDAVRSIRYGLTGVEAAFASTGSMLMATAPQTSRSASLLPLHHIALIPFNRLYATPEAWVHIQRQSGMLVDAMRHYANLSLITGPSKSADIESNLTLGVHGPKFVHAILFEDF